MSTVGQVKVLVGRWNKLGVDRTQNGGLLIAPMKTFGPYAYFHKLGPPLSEDEAVELESHPHIPLAGSLKAFYREANGLSLFHEDFFGDGTILVSAFSILGMRHVYRVGPPSILIEQPFDLVFENEVNGFAHDKRLLLISRYNADESHVFADEVGQIYRYDKGKRLLNTWQCLDAWLLPEVERIARLFSDDGELLVDHARIPPSPVGTS